MALRDLHRAAYTVECFLNALRLPDGRSRTLLEERLVRWLSEDGSGDRFVVFHADAVYGHDASGVRFHLPVLAQPGEPAVWCDGRKVSAIRAEQYAGSATVIRTGVSGLNLTMPGRATPRLPPFRTGAIRKRLSPGGTSSNNNNNNNNNNIIMAEFAVRRIPE